jgi:nucleoside-diphosphate-sugar epimerase
MRLGRSLGKQHLCLTQSDPRLRRCGAYVISFFSSRCAVYGIPAQNPVDEDTPVNPLSPHGRTKLVIEWMLQDAALAHGLRCVSLLYFNVGGRIRNAAPENARRTSRIWSGAPVSPRLAGSTTSIFLERITNQGRHRHTRLYSCDRSGVRPPVRAGLSSRLR